MHLFPLLLVVFGLTTGEFVIAGLLPDVAAGLTVPIPSAGLLVSAYALGMIVGGPVVTVLTARVARKPLITGLIVVAVLGNLGSAVAPGYALLLFSRFVAGLVVATFFAVGIAIAVSLAEPGKQASAVAKLTLGLNLGIVLGTPLGTFVGHHFGWRATFAAVALISLVALPLVLRFVPAQPAAATGSVLGELRVFASRELRWALLLTAAGNLGVVTVFVYITPLLTELSGFGTEAVPWLLLVYGAGAVAGNFLGGRLADRALLPSVAALLAALAGVLVVCWLLSAHRPAAAVLTFVLGLLAFAIIPGMQTRVVTTAGAAPTLAVAVNASGFQLASAFAGWLGGWLIEDGPGLGSLYLVGAALTVAGLGVALHSLRRDRALTPAPPAGT
ncbi:MFS transporter [Amycolatopsis sp. 195334CR]|uniref:MFS transporter n=1 Tax=Amycolatopsis sp. 195334CR TaxID=2814588 RepID=UPI001A8DC15B|nr:MFS transporter [Amycolatopsis sp. 195334CR]MBN6039492.1 MFS transporter [Amycolatopsis sp. 195334CR]